MIRAFAAVLSLLLAGDAWAARGRIALLVEDPLIEHAAVVALEPWHLEVISVQDVPPEARVPAAALAAQRIADRHHASAVVWITGTGSDVALWVYDVETQQLISRQIELKPPIDPGAAAAIALSAKTLLRASAVAPLEEQVGATRRPRERLRLEAYVGGQSQFGNPKSLELRFGAAVAYFFRRLNYHLGLAIDVFAGPGVQIERANFSGHYTDVTPAIAVRGQFHLARRWEIEPSVGASLHITTLDGGLPPFGIRAHIDRIDPGLDVELGLNVSLGQSVRLGIVLAVRSLLQYQRYLVNGNTELDIFPIELGFALRFTAGVL